MESEILDILEDLCYTGEIKDELTLREAVHGPNGGPRNMAYAQLIGWVTGELKILCQLEEQVTPISSPEDHSSFLMEVSSFIKELGCPHKKLMEGSVSQRLGTEETRLLLMAYLLGELQAARMISSANTDQGIKVEIRESEQAKNLKAFLITLLFPKPPNNITPKQLFDKVKDKISDVMGKSHPSLIGKPLFNGTLSDKQWDMLEQMQQEMNKEYKMRRQMLIKRLDVTVQSFQWSDRAKAKADSLSKAFRIKRDLMSDEPNVTLGHLLAAREDLAVLEKTSNASVRKNTKSKLNRIIIADVPDRGGRANELEPPPPEMPSWTQRSSGGGSGFVGGQQGGGRGGGGRGGGRGGNSGFSSDRVQGGWNQGSKGGYENRSNGGYENRSGSGYDNRSRPNSGYDNRNNSGYENNQSESGYDNRGGGGYKDYTSHSRGGYTRGGSGRGYGGNRGRGRGGRDRY